MDNATPWRCSLDLIEEEPPEIKWLVQGILPAESIVLLSAREGHMKTWLALDWAHAVAEGRPWLNHECLAGRVLWIDAEMPRPAFVDRLRAYGGSQYLNVWRWQDDNFPSRLDDPRLLRAAQEHDLIIVDSLRRFMKDRRSGQLDENDSSAMAEITGQCRQLTKSGATVVVLHHAVKDPVNPGYRGSSELGAGVDVVMHMIKDRDEQGEILTLSTPKTRYSEDASMTLLVTRLGNRPLFQKTSDGSSRIAGSVHLAAFDYLQAIIEELSAANGRAPSQTEVVEEAEHRLLATRNPVLRWLRQGEAAKRWSSRVVGRSRVYELTIMPPVGAEGHQAPSPAPAPQPTRSSSTDGDGHARQDSPGSRNVSTCPTPRGQAGLDNTLAEPPTTVHLSNSPGTSHTAGLDKAHTIAEGSVHQSNCPDPRGSIGLDSTPAPSLELVQLSTCPGATGLDRLDTLTSPASGDALHMYPIGSHIVWADPRLGHRRQQGAIEAAVEWPGLPEEVCYRVAGCLVPPSWVLGRAIHPAGTEEAIQ